MKIGNQGSKNSLNFIYGRLPSLNALTISKVKTVYLQNNFSDEKILSTIAKKGIKPKFVDLATLNKFSNNGFVAYMITAAATPNKKTFSRQILPFMLNFISL